MNNELMTILQEQAAKLPQEVVAHLVKSSWVTTLDQICISYGLDPVTRTHFKNETAFVLAGLVHPDAYRELLSEAVGPASTLDGIVALVEKEIFGPIRQSLIGFFEAEQARHAKDKPRAPIPRPAIPVPMPPVAPSPKPPTPPTPKPPTVPTPSVPTPKNTGDIPPNLPAEEPEEPMETSWKPRIITDSALLQPLPQTFMPLGAPSGRRADDSILHPFEKKMQQRGMSRPLEPQPIEEPLATNVVLEPIETPVAPELVEEPAETPTVSEPEMPAVVKVDAPEEQTTPVQENLVKKTPPKTPTQTAPSSSHDPYREPIE